MGPSRPTGVAYLHGQNALVVAARRGGQTQLIRVTPVEDLLGSLLLPDAETITLTANPATNSLDVIAGQDLLTVPTDQLSAPAPHALTAGSRAKPTPGAGSWSVTRT